MRLIDADVLRTSIEKDRDASDMPKMWYEGIKYAINHIIHAPTADVPERNVGKWIPVSERLPNDDEEGMDVLVSIKNASYSDYVETARFLYKNWWYADIDEEMDKEMAKCVIAWMPLPEPYREGAGDD